jgi:hypothetical protein
MMDELDAAIHAATPGIAGGLRAGMAQEFTDVLMTLIALGIDDQVTDPENKPRLDRESATRFTWNFGAKQFVIKIEGPYDKTL